jgi:hypothetical protein
LPVYEYLQKKIKNKDKKTHISAKRQAIVSLCWKQLMPLHEFLVMHLASLRVFHLDLFDEVHSYIAFYFPRSFDYDLPLLTLRHQICSMTNERDYPWFFHVQRIQNVE